MPRAADTFVAISLIAWSVCSPGLAEAWSPSFSCPKRRFLHLDPRRRRVLTSSESDDHLRQLQCVSLQRPRTPSSLPLRLSPSTLAVLESMAPKVGIVTSSALYLAPAQAVWQAVLANQMGVDLNPLPVAVMSVGSVAWLAYGLAAQDIYVTFANVLGAIGSIAYVVGVLPLLQSTPAAKRQTTQAVLMMGVASTLSLWTWLGVSTASRSTVSQALGLYASMLFIVLSASPLSTIRTVLAKRNSASILGPLTAAQVINTVLWSTYGLLIRDRFVWGPNVVGLGLGLIQLLLKLLFPSTPSE